MMPGAETGAHMLTLRALARCELDTALYCLRMLALYI